ncbi:hypothetical protein C5748_02200 [Phyllobacterium phragmitis]|uniref:25S rRNA (uridine-N(3))-methyltransferase BMT5-like domain-containing protein n=1 Tax=Phyllobacterium phragmitis TaxID=2670329 RepID=A0A2S9IX13_9HYPH|nr:class I SAM-dependent methyltransferase [Phyllobacterium phragmitis]PRD45062.1 hypothetical protein C5748_02200 [Phyllobacterium phragmitis]
MLLGEGNLSFSVSLAQLAEQNVDMVSTTFEKEVHYSETAAKNARFLRRRGIKVLSGVDATDLTKFFGPVRFDLIVFQFPNVGSREPLYGRNPNHVLVRRVLGSAGSHLSYKGQVAITVVNSPHYDGAFDMDSAAKRNGYEPPRAHPFKFSDYPGYTHVKRKRTA